MNTITTPELIADLPVDEALRELVASLEASFDEVTGSWHPCWQNVGLLPHNAMTGVPYRGINTVLLWAAQVRRRYQSPRWATYVQWSKLGAQVQRGARGIRCVRWVELAKRDPDDDSRAKVVPKVFTVFNPEQVNGAPTDESEGLGPDPDWYLHWMDFRQPIPAVVIEGEPCYVETHDVVQIPKQCLFHSTEEYCRSLAHELGHWTGHPTRLDRQPPPHLGSINGYAYEELVAEISASLTAAWLRVPETPIIHANHVIYIKGWLEMIREEPRILLRAAQEAQKATDHLLSYSKKGDAPCPVLPD